MTALSFAWTTPAVLAGYFMRDLPGKTETRRDWKPATIAKFQRYAESGQLVAAWTKQPTFKGAVQFATIRILEVVPREMPYDIPHEAWQAEGFGLLQVIGAQFSKGLTAANVWDYWTTECEQPQTVVKFEVVSVTTEGCLLWEHLKEAHGAKLTLRPDWTEFLPEVI